MSRTSASELQHRSADDPAASTNLDGVEVNKVSYADDSNDNGKQVKGGTRLDSDTTNSHTQEDSDGSGTDGIDAATCNPKVTCLHEYA